ncbi:DUF6390 family protein [Lolliginicoccus levis]|uniref:DUF6390 family protein n=1 Tax=Lolliginicoccus levis TaxID=2919542 RepID=UPI00241F0D04|nr:DUF6390 family protein [Lolliginicoccus levis]
MSDGGETRGARLVREGAAVHEGAALFARYAYPPNALGYCGPSDTRQTVAHLGVGGASGGAVSGAAVSGVAERKATEQWARSFDGAWPYLHAIAEGAGRGGQLEGLLDGLLDPEIVEAYWLGNPLLDNLDPHALLQQLRRDFAQQSGHILDGIHHACAHHTFHVLTVYPWTRLLGHGPAALDILQKCRIRWGTVTAVNDTTATVTTQPLTYNGQLALGDPTEETATWRSPGTSLAPRPHPGEQVALHWDWICSPLNATQLDALQHYTDVSLGIANEWLRERG